MLFFLYYYRPPTKCEKVMFSMAFVCLQQHPIGSLPKPVQICSLGPYHVVNSALPFKKSAGKRAVGIRLKCILVTVRNEVAKVMFLQVSVCPRGVWSGGVPGLGGVRTRGVYSWGGVPGLGGSAPRGCLVWADGYCCGRYTSYWNAFLFR